MRIWSRATGRTLRIFHDAGALDGPGAIGGFSADGSRLLLSDPSGDLDVWQPCPACEDAPALLRLADQRVTRELTPKERAAFSAGAT